MVTLLISFLQLKKLRFQLLFLFSLCFHFLNSYLIWCCSRNIVQSRLLNRRPISISKCLWLKRTFFHCLILLFFASQLNGWDCVLWLCLRFFSHQSAFLVYLRFKVILFFFGMAIAFVGVRFSNKSLGNHVYFRLKRALSVNLLLNLLYLWPPLNQGLRVESWYLLTLSFSFSFSLYQQGWELINLRNKW
jgi:hypothetical protein